MTLAQPARRARCSAGGLGRDGRRVFEPRDGAVARAVADREGFPRRGDAAGEEREHAGGGELEVHALARDADEPRLRWPPEQRADDPGRAGLRRTLIAPIEPVSATLLTAAKVQAAGVAVRLPS